MKILFYCGINNLVNFNRVRPYFDLCYGFDANPDKIDHAMAVYKKDPNVKFIYGALTEKGGEELEFTITTGWDPSSSLGNPNPDYFHVKSGLIAEQKKIKVPSLNLYEFCQKNNIHEIDTLITDLQGIDLAVLKTVAPLIREGKIREIQCEVEPDNTPPRYLGIPACKFKDFKELLSDRYEVLWVDPESPKDYEEAWEMDVRWRVKGGESNEIEFVLEHELLVPRVLPGSLIKSYSQYGEDVIIDTLLAHKQHGFYIDIGANNPDIISNTKLFYNKGWSGINIEPEPNHHARLCEKRGRDINLNVGVGPEPGIMTFYRMSADTLSSFNKEAALQGGKLHGATLLSEEPTPVMRLTDIYKSHLKGRAIDYMSVDAAGCDLAVLKSNDWSLYRPSLIIVEINVGSDEIVRFLEKQDYILIFDNGTNGIFIDKDFSTSINDNVREELDTLKQKYNLRTLLPNSGSQDRLTINVVYGHMKPNSITEVHKGNISILWSQLPIDGCDHYAYHNAFSYRGKLPGLNMLIMLEPVVVLPGEFNHSVWRHFDHVLTLSYALVGQEEKFHKILFPRADGDTKEPVTENYDLRQALYPLSGRKNGICMISGNKHSHVPGELYSKRIEVAEWFNKNSKIPFDVYGRPPFQLANYRGEVPAGQKLSVLKQYRFSLCFENTNHPALSAGYITEKILDCLEARTIPIYLGASNIAQYIPADCFIDFRKFVGIGELDKYLRKITQKEYERYIMAIDKWVVAGNLRKYSCLPMYDTLAEICAAASSKSLESLFAGKKDWAEGRPEPPTARNWKLITSPVMWTWKHLSKAEPPLLENGKIVNDSLYSNTMGIVGASTQHHKSFLIGKKPFVKVLFAGRKFSSGNARRGYDYGWWNLYDALNHIDNFQVQFFDYATEAQQRGVAGMSDRLIETIRKDRPDILLYSPFDLHADILHQAIRSITELTDTQTLIWMDDDHQHFDKYSVLWAPCVDYIITTSREAENKYSQAGFGQKIIKSQWAFNPFTYRPLPVLRTRDVSFVGTAHGNRSGIIEKMRQNNLAVEVFGFGWSDNMEIPHQDMVRIFNQTKVNLNLGDSFSDVQQIKRRTFEVPGCRGFLLTTGADDLQDYYEPDKEIVIATSLEEMIDKTRYYIAHENEREIIARRGYERTIGEYTWTHRLKDILQRIGFTAITKTEPHLSPLPEEEETPVEDVMVTIAVIAFNQLQYTRQCVESILHYTTGPYELLLTDNGSSDGTFEYFESVKSYHPNTRVIKNFENRIVEETGNYEYSLARGKYFVAVTNDTMVHEGWLENMIRQIESAPDIGMVGPRSNNVSGPQVAMAEYDTLEAYQAFAADWSKQHKGSNFIINRLVGFFFMIKKEVLERIGGADPDLPTNGRDGGYGFSDDDFTLRLTLAGYRSLVANDVFIHHYGSVTSSKYRPDLFGPAQNINKGKYEQKLRNNDRVSIGQHGEVALRPYRLDEYIPVAENTAIMTPRVCIGVRDNDISGQDHPNLNAVFPAGCTGKVFYLKGDSIQPWFSEAISKGEYDFIVILNKQLDPPLENISTLIDKALCFPDVAIMVPVGNYAPSTHAGQKEKGVGIEIIQYADLSFAVINAKRIRSSMRGLAHSKNDEEMFWFLQRRVRGEGYYIAKANDIVVGPDTPRINHPYDRRLLPERLMTNKQYDEAAAIYRDDLEKDPEFVDSLYNLACIAKERGQLLEAIQLAERALEINPDHIQSLIFLTRQFMDRGDLRRAREAVSLANLKQPGNREVQEIVARYEKIRPLFDSSHASQPAGASLKLINPAPGLTSIVIRVCMDLDSVNECIQSIKKHTLEPHEIIFIVHRTSPPTVKWAKQTVLENKNYRYIVNPEDLGFAWENNQGIRESSGEYIVILNNDAVVTENWLSGMIECLSISDNIGVVGPMTTGINGPQRIPDMGYDYIEQLDSLARTFREKKRHLRIPSRKIDMFCMMFKRKLAEKIGLFDEDFDSGSFADDDYCLRASVEGCRNIIAGDVFIYRFSSKNSIGSKVDNSSALARNKKIFDKKWSARQHDDSIARNLLIVYTLTDAEKLYQQGELNKAVELLLNKGIAQAQGDIRPYYAVAEMLIDARLFKDALDTINEIPAHGSDIRKLELAGYCKHGIGLDNEAEEDADHSLELDPTSAYALNLKGILAGKKGNAANAEEFYKKAIESDPSFGEPYTNLGVMKWAAGGKEDGLHLLEKGAILSPAVKEIVNLYYSAIIETGAFGRAETLLQDATAIYPYNKHLIYLLIDALIQQGKNDDAMDRIEKAMVTFSIDDGMLSAAIAIREKKDRLQADKSFDNKITVSLCMIVKNEEKYLAQCLASLKPITDEMIVVDTGSSDSTSMIAKAFGAKVYDFPWTGSFSDARNFSISKASGQWVFVMDADEVISNNDYAAFNDLIKKIKPGSCAYRFVTRNYVPDVGVAGWNPNDGRYLHEEKGAGWMPSTKVRLFPNNKDIRFENPVHELVEPSLLRLNIPFKEIAIPVHHYGKLNVGKTMEKGEEYYLLGKKKLDDNGGSINAICELAIQAAELKRYDDALELWQKASNIDPNLSLAFMNIGYVLIQKGDFKESIAASKRAMELKPDYWPAISNYALGELYAGDINLAISTLEGLLKKNPGYLMAVGVLLIAYSCNNQKEKGFECLTKLRQNNVVDFGLLCDNAKNLISRGKIDYATRLLEATLEYGLLIPEVPGLLADCYSRTNTHTLGQLVRANDKLEETVNYEDK